MIVQTHPHHLRRLAIARGVSPAVAERAIIERVGRLVRVDTDHRDYPRKKATPKPAAGWPAAHDLAAKPGTTADQLRAALLDMVKGYPSRQHQLDAYLKVRPIEQAASLETWLHDLHNAANQRAGKPTLTIEQARAERAVGGPVDLVYLWVDGSDPKWQASYRKHVGGKPSASRFTDAGELRASIESARRFAPWIRRTFIVTAGQRPAWLAEWSGVQIIHHRQIIPAKYLPTFNSHAIEPWLYRIPGLAERFLYANDDTLFLRPVTPLQFFNAKGQALMPFGGSGSEGTGIYAQACGNGVKVLNDLFGSRPWRRGWHQIKPYRRSMLAEIADRLPDDVSRVCQNKTRRGSDIAWNGVLWPGYAEAAGYAVPSPRGQITGGYVNASDDAAELKLDALLANPPHLLCINNGTGATVRRVREWLAWLADRQHHPTESREQLLTGPKVSFAGPARIQTAND